MNITAQLKQYYTAPQKIDKGRELDPKTREKMYAYELEVRLQEWGRWLATCLDNGLGFPSRNVLITALEGSAATAPHYPKDNVYAERVHASVLELSVRHKNWAEVLKIEYVRSKLDYEKTTGKTRSKNQHDHAKQLNLTYSNYLQYLRCAKNFVEGRISR
jgi:hypothetical protein